MPISNIPEQGSQADQLLIFTNLVTFHVSQAATNGEYAVFEDNVPPLGGPPPHTHPDEEIFYVLSGEFEFVLHDITRPFRVKTGSVVQVPSNVLHTFKNIGKGAGKLLCILTPGNLEQYFREFGKVVSNDSDKPDLNIPPDISKIDVGKAFEIAPKHHVNFFLPEVVR